MSATIIIDISGLESLIRTHPVLSLGVGVYIISYVTALCLWVSERRKLRRAEEKIHFCKEYLKEQIEYVNKNPSILKNLLIKSVYGESVRALKEN